MLLEPACYKKVVLICFMETQGFLEMSELRRTRRDKLYSESCFTHTATFLDVSCIL